MISLHQMQTNQCPLIAPTRAQTADSHFPSMSWAPIPHEGGGRLMNTHFRSVEGERAKIVAVMVLPHAVGFVLGEQGGTEESDTTQK